MELAGKYVGIGLGDASEEVGKIRDFLRRKFPSYAGGLPDTRTRDGVPLFDAPMMQVVLRMQTAYRDQGKLNPVLVNGVVGLSTKVVMGYLPAGQYEIRPMLFTVCGTGVPWWVGPDADTARALESRYKWQPIGYPAQAFPMGPSIRAGKAELLNQFEINKAQVQAYGFAMASYSQGAVIASEVWEYMKSNNHWAVPHFQKAVTWGNPSRERGKVYDDFAPGQRVAGPNTSGVAYVTDRMHDTPATWRDYAHAGDLYAAVEGDGPDAQDKTAIWRIVRGENFFVGPDTLLQQFLEIAQQPIPNAIGAFKAMMDAGMFFGGGLTQHTSYRIDPAIEFLRAW
jgi:hypothetical protein